MAKSFFGGVHPEDQKIPAASKSIEIPPPPARVVIPMSQHIGSFCQSLVAVGDYVGLGQKIGDGGGLCVPVHASVSGRVSAVEARPHPSGEKVLAVVIDNDFLDTPHESVAVPGEDESPEPEVLVERIRRGGCVGMGGAAFPTHEKIRSGLGKVDTLIINASECEPYITADDRLIREQPEKVLGGTRVLMKVFGLRRAVIVLESNKPEAAGALKAAIGPARDVDLLVRPVRYPQGAEKQLCQAVTGREIPPGALPAAIGCAVFNAASTAAVFDAAVLGKPLYERVVTLGGPALKEPKNYLVRIGTPFRHLIEAAGGFDATPYKVLAGGPMMGTAQYDLEAPVIKGTNALICLGREARPAAENPVCIRCGKCVAACPMHLMPLYLYQYEQKSHVEKLKAYNISDCIECGCCAYICPARIPLVHSFKAAKQKLRDALKKAAAAEGGPAI